MANPAPEQLPTIITSDDDQTLTIVRIRVPGEATDREVWIQGALASTLEFDGRSYANISDLETGGDGTTPLYG